MAMGPSKKTRLRRRTLALWGAVLVLAVVPLTAAAAQQDPFDAPRRYIERVMAERGLASVSVAVAKDGQVLWKESFGWADRERRIAATPHTMYSLASISKPITATGVMILAARGVVDLDAPINDYMGIGRLTGLAADAEGATVRRVLAHTSGLPLHYQFFYEDEATRPPPMDESISRYGIVTYPPGAQFQYSNIGYGVLDHLIFRASQRSYGEFLRRELFLPLGLTHTTVDIGPGLEEYAATRYDERQQPIPFYAFDHPGASAVFSSAHDLIRFGVFHLGHDVGGKAVLNAADRRRMQQLETPHAEPEGYGLGWFLADEFGHRKVWHTGSMPGVSTMLALYPDDDVAVVVLMNNLARDLRYSINQEIAASVIPGYAEARAAQSGGSDSGERAEERLPDYLVGRWEGTLRTWESEHPLTLEVQGDGDVHVRIDQQLTVLLNDATIVDGRLTGTFAGQIPTKDAMREPRHHVVLNLRLEGGRLYGQASAQTYSSRNYYALTSYAELTRGR